MSYRSHLLMFLVGLLASGCSTILQSRLRMNRFDNPEALGKSHGEFFAQSSRAVSVSHVPDIDEDPPRLNSVALDQEGSWSAGWGHGLMERWDLQLSYPWFARTKFQILGNSRQAAKKNNFSLAVGVGGGLMESVADDIEFDEDSNRGEMDLTLVEASVMVGWRPWEKVLLSASAFTQDITGRGKLQTETDDKYKLKQHGGMMGHSAGLHFFLGSVVLSGDYTRSDVHWSNGAKNDSYDSFAGRLAIRY
jgi:hypothetical protein